jgi:beta-glucanase (GH16 family)
MTKRTLKQQAGRAVAASLAAILVIFMGIGATQGASAAAKKVVPTVLWQETYSGKAGVKPNAKIWQYNMGNGLGWGNNELEYYTNKAAQMSTDGKGHMVITASQVDLNNPSDNYITDYCGQCVFKSARVYTRDQLSFQYGRIEARIQVPEGAGMWPAFWLLGVDRPSCSGWPSCGEIDIMEVRGSTPNVAIGSIHGPGYSGGSSKSNYYYSPDNLSLGGGYHVFRIDWLPNSIKYYVDGNLYGTETPKDVAPNDWVFNARFYMIMNFATGGNFDGSQLDTSIQSAKMSIDYVKYSTLVVNNKAFGKLYKY